MKLTAIGVCKGCNLCKKLEDGVCEPCLNGPKMGRKWAEMMDMCRRDIEFAKSCFSRIKDEGGRRVFLEIFNYTKEQLTEQS